MESSRVQSLGPDLAHTRPRLGHWIATAAAVAAVVAGASAFQPSDAKATSAPTTLSAPSTGGLPAAQAPDPRAAHYPMDCGRARPGVVDRASGDLDGDGRPETVAVVRCETAAGNPPSGLYVLAQPTRKGAAPRIVATFVDPKEGMSVQDFAVRGTKVSATLLGYSTTKVPRCCPDLQRKVNWQWKDGEFVLKALPVPGSV
ncbi:hypothetical protein [Streptomyces botrytidirepellens]|uniref:Secreted protein n=1 Tax=Streptomyces botrytidirepellens TaxID=2486417 RepID=A0A3M8W129_9ACTN|nr:hypothetical protein [Streptomyces botrytidirepellens]RNG23290.1 hypothetical protein EEJ42_18850 [Streptomyces botrytidirepellens]